ncbi:MAG: peptidase caspase catalytic subunit p20 [Holophagaceae bacterium]|nr:peptidase caspase catalytic subunit p20 [Holophagaceae bacterium]
MKRALIVGIDDYVENPLRGCVNDAIALANTIDKNGDGSPNFSINLLTSNDAAITTAVLLDGIQKLFGSDADCVLFYFAGHGIINESTQNGYIVSQNGVRGSWGVSIQDLITLANHAYPKIKSTVIILDSCHSGFAGEASIVSNGNVSIIGSGVTILTACHRHQTAAESNGHGLFTTLLLDGLDGSAADICGRITPASIYSHVDQTLGPWEQRPIYKANVQSFITLRTIPPKISLDILRRLPTYFPDPTTVFPLDPSFEPDRENIPEALRGFPVDLNNTRIFGELQQCNRHGLVEPVGASHMYYAAINATGCRLTAIGAHYRMLAEMKRI